MNKELDKKRQEVEMHQQPRGAIRNKLDIVHNLTDVLKEQQNNMIAKIGR